ncbi:MAG TPA: ABC transporter permease [Candidatus Acidoferrum sp.]|nr:ABC transporter permease [Candidatus Acidoferrum sp.]
MRKTPFTSNLRENLLIDLHYAVRSLRKDLHTSLLAVFALALGISACTVVFSVVYSVFVHALPYRNFRSEVVIEIRNTTNEGGWTTRDYFFPDEVRAFQENNHVFDEMIEYVGIRPLYDNGEYMHYWPFGSVVSSNTFAFLGVPALLGRTITEEDGRPGAPAVFVMNYRFWKKEFSSDPTILGKEFILNGTPTILVGIMPQKFNAFASNFWIPANAGDGRESLRGGAKLIARLKPGISIHTATADLNVIGQNLPRRETTDFFPRHFTVVIQPWLDSLIGNFKKALYALLSAVFLLLLIACANVANLLLARATTRGHELAIRCTLGASRAQIAQQLLIESSFLAAVSAVTGCFLAGFLLKIVIALIPVNVLPAETVIRMSFPVVGLSLAVAAVTSIFCGLIPVVHIVRPELQSQLTTDAKGRAGGFQRRKLRSGIVVAEIALTVVLLTSAGILLRGFISLTHTDLGFNPHNVLYFRFSLPKTYNTDVDVTRQLKNNLTRQVLEGLSTLPGVLSVSESVEPPPLLDEWSDTIIPGKPHTARWQTILLPVSEGYFSMFGLPLLQGRPFTEGDIASARLVMVVNQSFVRQYLGGESAIGRKVKMDVLDRTFLDAPHNTYFEIIGIVGDQKTRDFEKASWEDLPQAFIPYSVQGYSWRTYMARTAVAPNTLGASIDHLVHSIDPSVTLSARGTLEDDLKEFYRGPQFELLTFGAFAAVGLLLVLIGIFGLMAYTVSLRTHEIGIRVALGAQRTNIFRLIVSYGFSLLATGIIFGLAASYAFARFLASQIPGISAADSGTSLYVAVLILGVGLIACLIPARHASKLDPLIAIRHD